jgi:release factor glutamine methyltransferase
VREDRRQTADDGRRTIRTALRDARTQLDAARVDAPVLTARLLLATVLGRSKEWLLAHDDESLDDAARAQYAALLVRVVAHEPLAYVLGVREFYGMPLHVDSRVLIPRPETEMLVELTLASLRGVARAASGFDHFDIGTGSGAVSIAVAKHAPDARVLASDVSADALDVARENARRQGVADRITFMQSDLLASIDGLPTVLTANLPYVTREEIDGLPPEIQEHEPRVALDGGDDGLDLVRALLAQIAERRATQRQLIAAYFEIGASQGAATLAAARRLTPDAHAEMLRDLGARDRVLALRW